LLTRCPKAAFEKGDSVFLRRRRALAIPSGGLLMRWAFLAQHFIEESFSIWTASCFQGVSDNLPVGILSPRKTRAIYDRECHSISDWPICLLDPFRTESPGNRFLRREGQRPQGQHRSGQRPSNSTLQARSRENWAPAN